MVFYDSDKAIFSLILASFALGLFIGVLFDIRRFLRFTVFGCGEKRRQKRAAEAITASLFDLLLLFISALATVVLFSCKCSGKIRADALAAEAAAVFLYYKIIGKRSEKAEEKAADYIRKCIKRVIVPIAAKIRKAYRKATDARLQKTREKTGRALEKKLLALASNGFQK